MTMRPVDIAKRLKVSTTTLRHYEAFGMIPEVKRSSSGYRIYTSEHIAYFICIRDMMHGFILSEIAVILKLVITNQVDDALWIVNKAQASLQMDKTVCDKIKQRFLLKKRTDMKIKYSIDAVSKATGIVPSTIRYWDNIGLITASRSKENNYRTFTQKHMDEILIVQTLKFAMQARGEKYAVEQIRKELHAFDSEDTDKISAIIESIEHHLATLNRSQIRSIAALYHLCNQIEQNEFDTW